MGPIIKDKSFHLPKQLGHEEPEDYLEEDVQEYECPKCSGPASLIVRAGTLSTWKCECGCKYGFDSKTGEKNAAPIYGVGE